MTRQQLAKIRMSLCDDERKYIEIMAFLDGDRCICDEEIYGQVRDNYGDGDRMYPALLTPDFSASGAPVFHMEWGGTDQTRTELDFETRRPVQEGQRVVCREDGTQYLYEIERIEVLLDASPGHGAA